MNKKKIMMIIALTLTFAMVCSSFALADDYVSFNKSFKKGSGLPSSLIVTVQTVRVTGTGTQSAKAYCTSYSSSPNTSVLSVYAKDNSVTSTTAELYNTGVVNMTYLDVIPTDRYSFYFEGKMTLQSSNYTIAAKVKG